MRKLLVVILCLLMTQASVAQTKIVVLSDLHLMAPTLLVNDGPAWRDLLADSRTLLDFSQPLLDEAVERVKAIIKAEHSKVTEDIYKLIEQYKEDE